MSQAKLFTKEKQMKRFIQERWPWLEEVRGMRLQLLDDEMLDTISAFSKEDLTKRVDRSGFHSTVEREVDHYGEALLIFFGKATIYLKAMNKPVPESIESTIG